MPAWFMEVPSETDIVVKLTGTPPPAATPSLAWSACGASDMEQGVFSPAVVTMPTKDMSKSRSSRPVARRKALWGARASPSVMIRERCLCSDMARVYWINPLWLAGAGTRPVTFFIGPSQYCSTGSSSSTIPHSVNCVPRLVGHCRLTCKMSSMPT